MSKRQKLLLTLAIVLVFGGYALYSFGASLNPYVTFAQAASRSGSVQVMGTLDKSRISFQEGQLSFYLTDEEGTTRKVVYNGSKPNNLEHADSVVVAGILEGQIFMAQRILVKCPSKYQEGRR